MMKLVEIILKNYESNVVFMISQTKGGSQPQGFVTRTVKTTGFCAI